VNPVRSVVARLSFALGVVVAGALAVVWVALVPTLQHRLVAGKERQLLAAARAFVSEGTVNQDTVDEAAREAIARVVYFYPETGGAQIALLSQVDSAKLRPSSEVQRDPVALRAASSMSVQRGVVTRAGESYAEVALPDPSGNIVLFSGSLHDTLQNVDLVRTRLLWSGLAALGLAVLAGWVAAAAFARRIRRLERAADRIAAGDFGQPVVDPGRDELGQLATAFDRMRNQLAQLDDARRAFIANASHELRTPIFSLGGFLELLRDEELDEATRLEFLATASEQVERLSKLATDLLDLSRLDAGGMRLELEPVSLGEIARELANEFAALALRDAHPLEALDDDGGLAFGDRQRVLQIGRALVDNALRHTPPGTPVRIAVHGAELAVEDAGQGIPLELQEQVFARFTRLDGSRASGTGLGLAIARELAERMDGELRLDSAPGRTVFTLVLPAAVLQEPEPALRA
jgi:signal transduction histidine kinase